MSLPDIPQPFKMEIKPTGPFDVDMDAAISGSLSTDSKLTSDSKVATDSKVDIVNLPHFTLQDIKDMMKVRVHIPNYSNVCFKMFGIEFFSICVGGEAQVITEPYIPTAAEKCEDTCCEPDTRPFPDPRTNVPG